MSSKHLRGDVNYAWPSAEVAVMGAKVTADATQNSECVLRCSSSIDRAKKKQTSLLFKTHLSAHRVYFQLISCHTEHSSTVFQKENLVLSHNLISKAIVVVSV